MEVPKTGENAVFSELFRPLKIGRKRANPIRESQLAFGIQPDSLGPPVLNAATETLRCYRVGEAASSGRVDGKPTCRDIRLHAFALRRLVSGSRAKGATAFVGCASLKAAQHFFPSLPKSLPRTGKLSAAFRRCADLIKGRAWRFLVSISVLPIGGANGRKSSSVSGGARQRPERRTPA